MSVEPLKILFTGDLCPHNRIEALALEGDFRSIFNDFTDVLNNNDLVVTDLECSLTDSTNKRTKTGPHQKAKPECIDILKYMNTGLAALANNHIMDYGAEGISKTIELCMSNGIDTVGAGRIETAKLPYIKEIKGKKVAIINIADNEFLTSPDRLFIANPIDLTGNFNDIRESRKHCDFVIIFVHAGNEFYHLPSPRLKKIYRFFIDTGADAVLSNHTHCFSGYEIYNYKPIFYGLGNFIYDWPGRINSEWNKGYVVRLALSDKIRFEIIPLKQCNEKSGIFHLNESELNEFNIALKERNDIIANDQRLEEEFEKYISSSIKMYDSFIEPYFGKAYNALRQRGFLPDVLGRRKRLLLLNLVRCESHREVLLEMLKKYEK